jgi:hypothetical protein
MATITAPTKPSDILMKFKRSRMLRCILLSSIFRLASMLKWIGSQMGMGDEVGQADSKEELAH